ncbi:transposon i [Colletotrichum incanum]|uniref:Transposon i n=1 Tax=Colletotrichum incanum TaxID=1573173 RepID=A0A166LBU6_COLIC|nr:transposon i [Colletotrichum incanum]
MEAIHALTPKAKLSPYSKRWWTTDLTQLRRIYSYWRNRARVERRAGIARVNLEEKAKAAAKQYHDAIRQQKRKHWKEVPQLVRPDKTTTTNNTEQAEELLTTFFPALPDDIEDEESSHRHASYYDGRSGTVTVCDKVLEGARRGRASGGGVEADMAGRAVMGAVDFPNISGRWNWKHAKIIPLKKPGKDNYTLAKAWRPISLLATLGKVLESVVAERISHAVEFYGLLPTNYFGARKQRSAEQALLLF